MLALPLRPVRSAVWSPAAIALGLSAAAVIVRAILGAHTPLGAGRAVFACAAFAVVARGRHRTFFKRAMLALALEASVGLVTFVWIDLPFVRHHTPQIAMTAAGTYARFTHRDLTRDLARLDLLPRASAGR